MTRRRKTTLLVIALLLLVGASALRWVMRPDYMVPVLLELAGESLGLEITATGVSDYRLRGTPQLIARNLTAREPGAKTAVLRAERLFISVPWSTLRARGSDLTARRLELEAPILDLAALQRWQAKRPAAETPIPTLSHGIGVTRGSIVGEGWKVDNVNIEVPMLAPERPLRARIRGRYTDPPMRAPIDTFLSLTEPASGAGVGMVGQISLDTAEWRLPTHVKLSAKLRTETGFLLENAVLGARARYISGGTSLPFAVGIAGPLRYSDKGIGLRPVGFSLRGEGMIPHLDAAGETSIAEDVQVDLKGLLANWPSAWPALPPPLGQSTSPVPFALSYEGASDLSSVASLTLQRDATVFEGHFRLFEVMDWLDAGANDSPLPPIAGVLKSPKLEISGAILEGVELELEDPAVVPAAIP